MWSERRNGKGAVNFITGAGGFLQAVIYGYGGFRIRSDGLYFNSTLPPGTTKLTLSLHYLGCSLKFELQDTNVTFVLVSNGPISPDLEVSTKQGVFALRREKPVTLETKDGVVRKRVSTIQSEIPQSVKERHNF